MAFKGRFTTVLIELTLFGCQASLQTFSANAGESASSSSSGDGAPSGGGTRVENIVDTTLDNKTAFYVTIPAKWKFQGILLQGGVATCESYAYSVYRATSEDGQSFGEMMPELLWAYGNGPKPKTGCLPL